jgi:Zn-dependent M28 family amino/carboxypeptidase
MRVLTAVVIATLVQATALPPTNPTSVVEQVGRLATAADNNGRFDALTALLRAADLSFAVEPFTIDRPAGGDPRTQGRNVIASLGQGERTILLGAHYDAAWLSGGAFSRGALDNAASAVLLVHAALALRAERLGGRVLFVWFDMEESNLIGSRRYIEAHSADRVTMMLNFDINAYGDTILYAPSPAPAGAPLRAAIEHTCADLAIDCLRFSQLPPSDDRPFTRAGVPAASFATLPVAEAHHLWLSLNTPRGSALAPATPPPIMGSIHTPSDTLDKVDGATVIKGAQFAAALVRQLAR